MNTNGADNTATGAEALLNNATGNANTATGKYSLHDNTTGFDNTATGHNALRGNTTGEGNTATGRMALTNNISGVDNTATGKVALGSEISGGGNTATGTEALYADLGGNDNTATGHRTMFNSNGSYCTADGAYALYNNQAGSNTAIGYVASYNNTGGSGNTALGGGALQFNTTGNNNIGIGSGGGIYIDGSNNIAIGNYGVSGDNNAIRIGTTGTHTATFVAGISGTPVVGDAVVVDSNGQLGTIASSARFKKDVQPMDKNSEALLALKPVRFHYKSDTKATPQFGLIAEEVAKVNPDLVVRDRKGEIYSVRYDAVNAMLLNEFLKAHRQIEEQDKRIDELTAQLKQQAALIQKVSDKVQMNRPAPQMAVNDQ
jgi:hypothetical protein